MSFECTNRDLSKEVISGWHFSNSKGIVQVRSEFASEPSQRQPMQAPDTKEIKHVTLDGATANFERIVSDGLPVVLKGLNIGPCVGRWTLGYVSEQLGEDRKVRVHVW